MPAAVTVTFGVMLAGPLTAQTFTVLHSFSLGTLSSGVTLTNQDGAEVHADLVPSGNTLYGATSAAGIGGFGTVFKLNVDGTDFRTLHEFVGCCGSGAYPYGIIEASNILYGTTSDGGSTSGGTVFKVNADGTDYAQLVDFRPPIPFSYGGGPQGPVLLSSNRLYGTTYSGGFGDGSVFAMNTDGTGFVQLYAFTAVSASYPQVNNDGAWPVGALVLSGSALYGVASGGGVRGNGTVFVINNDGTGFTNLHNFSDGNDPSAGLTLVGNTLYGTTQIGGIGGNGTLFKINTDGSAFTTLRNFSPADGTNPLGKLFSRGSILYGTTRSGGAWGNGTVFAVNVDGTGFTTLHSFAATTGHMGVFLTNSDEAAPSAGLILSGLTLYGTTFGGGPYASGTIFGISMLPQLTITPAGETVTLTWPTNYAGFDYTAFTLQSTTNLGPSAVWTTNLPPSVVVNGLNTVTNPMTGAQQFFRLCQYGAD